MNISSFSPTLLEEDYFSVMDKYFTEKGPVYHQFESYEYMISYLIQKIIDETPSINYETKSIKYKTTFGQVYIENAGFVDESHKVKYILPGEARLRNLTYDSPVFIDIKEEFWEYDEKKEEFNKTDEIFHKKILLMKVPTMVRSSKCNLYGMSMKECIDSGECSNDPGGYFIINGKERALVCQERLNYNHVYVFNANDDKIPFVADIRSMSEETGHSVLIQAKMNKEMKNITFSLPYMSKEVSAGSVFKALGFNSKDIIKFINPKTKEETLVVDRIIRESIHYTNKEKAMRYISKSSIHKVEDDEDRRLIYTQQVIENELFPHMGISTPLEKALLLGDMLNKLIRVCIGMRLEDDRDNVSLKRIEAAGVLISDLFRMCMKRYCDNIKKYVEKRQDILTAMTRTNNITSSLKHVFSTGNWAVQKNSYVRTGVSQIMSRLTYPATISHLRRVIIPIGKEGKNVKIRQIHPTQCFFIDIIESPEGKSIGIVKNLALLANITTGFNSILVRELVEKCEYYNKISDDFFENCDIVKLYINGILVGFTYEADKFYQALKNYRKMCIFSSQVSFYYDEDDKEIRLLCDHGRFIRPVLTVKDNKLCLEKSHLDMTWSELVENDIVRYIDSNEIEHSLIAMNPGDLEKFSQSQYDYCEIHPSSMMGVCSAVIPYPEHNQSPRLVYQSSMVKQALGMYSLAFKERFDTISHIMHYPQKPLVSTRYDKMLKYDEMLTGCNPVVAILTYGGWNQEDSVMINKAAVDRGMFVHTCYKTLQCEENKKTNCTYEKVEVPPKKSQNNTYNYSKLSDNGIIKKGTPVAKGDIIVGKTLTKVKTDEDDDKTDCSLAIGNGDEGIIDEVWEGFNGEGNKMIKIRIRQIRIPEVGDKIACFDETTSILTSKGWKNVKDISLKDKIATLQDNKIVYDHPINTFVYDYKGKIYHLESQQLDVFTTPNHNLYVKKRNHKEYGLYKAEDLFGKRVSYKKDADWDQKDTLEFSYDGENYVDTKDWCYFLGIWMAEGWASGKESYGCIGISVNKERVRNKLFPCLDNMDIKYTYDLKQEKCLIYKKSLYMHMKPMSLGASNKFLPDYVWGFSKDETKCLLEGMMLGDGHINKHGAWRYYTSSYKLAEDVQRLSLHCGYSGNISLPEGRKKGNSMTTKDGRVITTKHDNYVVAIIISKNKPTVNHGHIHEQKGQIEEWVEYEGKVYCAEVPGNIMYVKRNDKPYWCGNSRSSQKGVCGLLLNQEDMPFTSQGITPDVLINPHCFTGENKVSLYNGLSKKIQDMTCNESLWTYQYENSGLAKAENVGMEWKGFRNVIELTLQNGRKIKCTPDHKFYTVDKEWVEAKDIKSHHKIMLGIEGVEDINYGDEKDWSLKTSSFDFSCSTKLDREKSMAFTRILGYLLADGCISQEKRNPNQYNCPINFGHIIDAEICLKDIELITKKTPKILYSGAYTPDRLYSGAYTPDRLYGNYDNQKAKTYVIHLPSNLSRSIALLDGITIGRRVLQDTTWPSFIFSSPKSMIREFLAGLFGGDGHAPYISKKSVMGIKFSQSIIDEKKDSFSIKMNKLCDLLNMFGVEAEIERIREYKTKDKTFNSYYIKISNSLKFSELIGFRYCTEKMCRLSIYKSYKEFQDNIKKQYKFVLEKYEEYKDIERARNSLIEKEPVLNEYYSLIKGSNRFREYRSKEIIHFNYMYFPSFDKYIKDIGCDNWFSSKEYIIKREQTVLPTYYMSVVGSKDMGKDNVYCIGVEKYHNFICEGSVVRNCMPSRMTMSQLIETLLGKTSSLSGNLGDSTAFSSSSINPINKISEELKSLGYERHGNERMCCGYTGEMLEAEVFIGPTYYQRLKHLVKDKMHCLTLDHQVLTRNGWKNISNITIEDKVATLNKKGELEYKFPTRVWKYENYDGMMYHIKNQSIDLSVTGNHRMWLSKMKGPRGNVKWSEYDFEKAEDIVGKHRRYKKDAIWINNDYQFSLPSVKSFPTRTFTSEEMNLFLVFFGIWYAEGWASGKMTYGRVTISVNKQRVKDALFDVLKKLNYEYIYDQKDEKLYVSNNQLYNYMKPLSVGAPSKKLPDWVLELSVNQTKILIESMVLGDGFYKKGKMIAYYTSSKELADQFQQLCLHAGWSCIMSIHLKAGQTVQIDGRDVSNKYDVLRLSIITTKSQPSVNHSHCHDQNIQEEKFIQETCDVMCITVPNEVFYVRRNGKTVWTGNSRSRGNVTMMHHQPSEGRSRDGGLRTGEMERDSLIAHGGSAFIQETFFDMSDVYNVNVCNTCSCIISNEKNCRVCKKDDITRTNIPYCTKLLFQELQALGVKVNISAKP